MVTFRAKMLRVYHHYQLVGLCVIKNYIYIDMITDQRTKVYYYLVTLHA